MANEVKVPDIGDFKDVPIIEIHVKEGDAINAEDPLVTLESDKATMDVPAPSGGTVERLMVKVGDRVSKGSPILLLKAGAGAMTQPPSLITQQEPPPTAQPVTAAPSPRRDQQRHSRQPLRSIAHGGGFRAGPCEPERATHRPRTRCRSHEDQRDRRERQDHQGGCPRLS